MKADPGLPRAEWVAPADAEKPAEAGRKMPLTTPTDARDENRERQPAALESSLEGVITFDTEGVIESFDAAAEEIFGYRAAEIIGQNLKLLMPEPYQGGIASLGQDVVGRRKNGSLFPMDFSVSDVHLAGRGVLTGFVRDITEHKTAEKALLHFVSLVESSEDAIVGKTLDGYITSWNHGAESLFGYKSAEAIGKHISLIIPPDRRVEEMAILEKIRHGQSVEHYETMCRRKDGSLVAISVTISPIREKSGKIVGASKVARNITDRRRLESEILEISEREQRRIGNDLHDGLCQELAGIELMCQVLEQKLAAKSKAQAKQVGDIALHIREATMHARKLARGLSPVELEVNGFTSALHELADNTKKLLRAECRLECPERVSIRNNVMATHLYRIAQEAVNNAVKHGHARNIEISLQPAGEKIALTVRDDGVGFPKEARRTGSMGLQIMKYRAGVVGATLRVEPGPAGRGTIVTCIFPGNL